MRLAVLFSGGKDSCYALHKASQEHEIVSLITIVSENMESYMFHTPNIHLSSLQARSIGLPLISVTTSGEKERELDELRSAILRAKNEFGAEGVVTGAVGSVYQATRIQKICDEFSLWCFNPLWQKDQLELLREIISAGFEVIISGIYAYPFDSSWLGRRLDAKMVDELSVLQEKYSINPAGEGGELETTVLDAPFFKKRLEVGGEKRMLTDNSGIFMINKQGLAEK